MSETQQAEQGVPEKANKPMDVPHTDWTLLALHRRPAVVVLIALLIVLQVVLGGIVAVQARRLLELGERIEQLEKK
jgi:hypothetical protein